MPYEVPPEPRRGEPLDVKWGVLVSRALRALRMRSDDGSLLIGQNTEGTTLRVRGGKGGGGTTAAEGALRLTTTAPPGYVAPEGSGLGTPVFMTWGTAGGVIAAPETFDTPIAHVTEAGTRYVWAKIGLSDTVSTLCTSLEFVTDTSPTAFTTGAFNPTTGAPPEFMYVPLGSIVATGTGGATIQLNNSGAGSIVVASHIYNAAIDVVGQLTFQRMLSWWRTQSA